MAYPIVPGNQLFPDPEWALSSIARLRGQERERNNCFSKIQLVGLKYRDKKTFKLAKRDSAAIVLVFGTFRY